MFNDKERDMNPPEPREEYEPDWDSINDDKWLRKKEEEENELRETNTKTKCAWKDTKDTNKAYDSSAWYFVIYENTN